MERLPERERLAFQSRLWLDDETRTPELSQERRFAEARERQRLRTGSAGEWERPWTRTVEGGVSSVSDKLSEQIITLRSGQKVRLGDLQPKHQMYYMNQWYNDAKAHFEKRLKSESGGLTPQGMVVEKYLRLEATLAHVNNKEISARRELPIAHVGAAPRVIKPHSRPQEHPAITFFRTNQELARRLGVANHLDTPITLRQLKEKDYGITGPTSTRTRSSNLTSYHQLHENMQKVPNLVPVLRDAAESHAQTQAIGSWQSDQHGNSEWKEDNGVVALHEASAKLHSSHGQDAEALTAYTKATITLGKDHPMVKDYTSRLGDLGLEPPTNSDLAKWKNHAHQAHRDAANRMHVIEFVNESRATKKSIHDLRKAFDVCAKRVRSTHRGDGMKIALLSGRFLCALTSKPLLSVFTTSFVKTCVSSRQCSLWIAFTSSARRLDTVAFCIRRTVRSCSR